MPDLPGNHEIDNFPASACQILATFFAEGIESHVTTFREFIANNPELTGLTLQWQITHYMYARLREVLGGEDVDLLTPKYNHPTYVGMWTAYVTLSWVISEYGQGQNIVPLHGLSATSLPVNLDRYPAAFLEALTDDASGYLHSPQLGVSPEWQVVWNIIGVMRQIQCSLP